MHAIRLFTILSAPLLFLAVADCLEAQTISHVPLYTFYADDSGDLFGSSVSDAGDVNGDGTPDVIVGAPLDDNNDRWSGSARVISGSDGSVLYSFDGDSEDDFFGSSVSGAGDVNGDGWADLIIGATGDNTIDSDSGSARVLSGSDGSILYTFYGSGFFNEFGASVSGVGDVNGDGRPDLVVGASGGDYVRVLSGIDGSILYTVYSNGEFELYGISVSDAGDVNGDGATDLIVSGRGSNDFIFSNDRVRVLSGIDGSVLHTFIGDRRGDYFGSSVSGAGDVNGDGKADLIIGAAGDDTINGSSSGSVRVLSGMDGSILYTFIGDRSFAQFGASVSSAGDVNGDGRADMIVGAPSDDESARNTGSARVLSGVDGSVLYTFIGDTDFSRFGSSVSGVGDINGDGIDDFIVGADTGGANGGGYAQVFVSQISEPELLLGDLNLDATVNFLDISPFISVLLSGGFQAEADINRDEIVDFLDINPFIELLAP